VQPQQQPQAADWSQSLLKLAQPRKKKRKGGNGSDSISSGAEEVFFSGSSQQQQLPWDAAGLDADADAGEDEFSSSSSSGGRMLVEKKKLPAAVRCFDTARIYVKGGDGGAGCVAFRREPYVEKGGPNGGNGGKGGNVWAVADEGMNSLLSFRNQLHYRAGNGYPGGCVVVWVQSQHALLSRRVHGSGAAPSRSDACLTLPACLWPLARMFLSVCPPQAKARSVTVATAQTATSGCQWAPSCGARRQRWVAVCRWHELAGLAGLRRS
jgi:hypothetical protein